LIPPGSEPGGPDRLEPAAPDIAAPLVPTHVPDPGSPADPGGAPPPSRPGASTFTIDGRAAPALFVVGWLGTISGLALIVIGALSGGGAATIAMLMGGLSLLAIGLICAAGSQGIERRAAGRMPYQGPSPILVFAAAIPISVLAGALIGLVITAVGIDVQGPIGQFLSVLILALVYIGLIRLLVVDAGALSWAEMGLRRLDGRALLEMSGGALWALPVIIVTVPISAILITLLGVTPESPLPPAGENTGFALQLLAGAIIAPFGEEILFRGLATTAWVRSLGVRRGIVRAALVFALAHVIGVAGSTFGETAGLAVIGFATRVPVALALGWLFVRSGSIWSSFGLHAAFNAILLILAEAAIRSTSAG
jgi:membrane protease YdiL (CAAX protease family)